MRVIFPRTLLTLSLLLSTSVCSAAPKIDLDELSQQIIDSYSLVTDLHLQISAIVAQIGHIQYKQEIIDRVPFETPHLPLTKSVWSAQKELELLELEKRRFQVFEAYMPAHRAHEMLLDKYIEATGKVFAFPAPKAAVFSTTYSGYLNSAPPSLKRLLNMANQNSLLPVKFLDRPGNNPCQVELERPNKNPPRSKADFIQIDSSNSMGGLTRTESSSDFDELEAFDEDSDRL